PNCQQLYRQLHLSSITCLLRKTGTLSVSSMASRNWRLTQIPRHPFSSWMRTWPVLKRTQESKSKWLFT
ncbi:hypothetical protein KXX06_006047, partial [Aspergillus fumigatus]